ncbi:MAG: type I-D CRISPR-associated helicase Cas3' [Pseudanabaena sp. M051S1SP1A06QC]|nr:type I-D CRISPR-associated helicase Cas3' [Pseudanabaena sp. M051S1SP1A06QC]
MTEYKIVLKPVYSETVETPKGIEIPDGWRLAWHQLETFKALQDPDIDVVFNTAMTGDGKSLAAYLGVLQGSTEAIALYPTNELARDQENQIHQYVEDFQPRNEPRIARLNSAELELYAENESIKKSAAIATHGSQREILITNPDIFHYLHRGAYLMPKDSPDKLWGRIDKDFNLFIFDEFHIFSAPQIASVLNTMLLIHLTNRRKKFLFLSATPDQQLLERLDKAKLRYKLIDPKASGKYQFPDNEDQSQQLEQDKWRLVTREITLHFVPLESVSKASETWLKDNLGLILNHFLEHRGTKGAIILNSIASVKRLTPLFAEAFAKHGLTVGENTGLSSKTVKERSLSCDLVLGTSTIDVGVDFKINFLIFESADSGSFIQRLGRLGRHQGYVNADGQEIKFAQFVAYTLAPNYLIERLFEKADSPFANNGIYDRAFLSVNIYTTYRKINDFKNYYSRWGALQSFDLYRKLGHKTITQQYAVSRDQFRTDCEEVFGVSLGKVAGKVKACQTDWQEKFNKDKGNPIAEDASSFRGSSPLQCGLYDMTEPNEGDRFKTYDLTGILSNLEIEPMTEAAFMRLLKETSERTGQPIPKSRFEYCMGFMKLLSYREERSNWKFAYNGDLKEVADSWKVQVLSGIGVWQPDNRWIDKVNERLKKQAIVAYVLNRPVSEIKARLLLPMHFQIYGICDQQTLLDPVPSYAIAFGQSALLLDTLAYTFKNKKGGEIWIA